MTAGLRWDMMNSLRNQYQLKGMTEDNILDLLGVPERSGFDSFYYYLGNTKTGMNTGSLNIEFDKERIVKNIHVWEGQGKRIE